MKKLSLLLALAMIMAVFAGCGRRAAPAESGAPGSGMPSAAPGTQGSDKTPVELNVVTSYGSDDGNRPNYEKYYKAYEEASGNAVRDASGTSNEEWKARIMADFETGAEPDVLFFFTGIDANRIIQGGKVVSLEEIRAAYPDYASNMDDSRLPKSPVDQKQYAVPVNGYWEGLFVNKKVLADCGVAVPGPDTTWEQFVADCEKIAAKGYTPIAASLQEVPHYWFEFTVFNHTSVNTHANLPASSSDDTGKAWVAGLNTLKEMYDKGFFPKNTTTATDPETNVLMTDDKAAFMIDGSWKIGWFAENAPDINNFTVTYVPAMGERKPTDIVGGISMGYYITKKAWNNPEKQAACVDFIKYMTSDEAVSAFGATAVTALKNGTTPPEGADALVMDALSMVNGATGFTAATGDGLNQNARGDLFANVKNIVTGSVTPEQAIDQALAATE